MVKTFMKILAVSLVIVLIFVVAYSIYLKFTYIDNKVESGMAYGFKIGESKLETFNRARNLYKTHAVFILHPLDKNSYGPHVEIHFNDEDFELLKKRDKWTLYYDEGFFDLLDLTFDDDSLESIYRHRKKFELP